MPCSLLRWYIFCSFYPVACSIPAFPILGGQSTSIYLVLLGLWAPLHEVTATAWAFSISTEISLGLPRIARRISPQQPRISKVSRFGKSSNGFGIVVTLVFRRLKYFKWRIGKPHRDDCYKNICSHPNTCNSFNTGETKERWWHAISKQDQQLHIR